MWRDGNIVSEVYFSYNFIFLLQEVNAATVVMFSALYPLTSEAACSFLETQHPDILQFVFINGENTKFKVAFQILPEFKFIYSIL